MKTILMLAGATLALTLSVGAAQASELLVNGGFEDGNFTGWTQGGNTGFTGVASSGFGGFTSYEGAYFAALGPNGSDGTLSQTFADHAGESYTVSFAIASDGGTPSDFGVTGPGGLSLSLTDLTAEGYDFYSAHFVGSGSDTITFNFRNDPGYLALDAVSVSNVVPEPAAWALMLVGFGLAGAALRRRKVPTVAI